MRTKEELNNSLTDKGKDIVNAINDMRAEIKLICYEIDNADSRENWINACMALARLVRDTGKEVAYIEKDMREEIQTNAWEKEGYDKLAKRVGKEEDGTWPAYAWPGGYTMVYITNDCCTICAKCMNKEDNIHFAGDKDGWLIEGADIIEESSYDVTCENCNEIIFEANLTEDGKLI